MPEGRKKKSKIVMRLESKDDIRPKAKNPIEWFKNYWYFYKLRIVIIGLAAIFTVAIVISAVTKVKYDFQVVVIDVYADYEDDYHMMADNLSEYLTDVNNDGKLELSESNIRISSQIADEYDAAAYEQLTAYLLNDDVQFFIVDDYSYEYLKNSETIELLSDFGVTGYDEYSIKLSDTPVMDGTSVKGMIEYYLVAKKESNSPSDKKHYEARREALTNMLEQLAG